MVALLHKQAAVDCIHIRYPWNIRRRYHGLFSTILMQNSHQEWMHGDRESSHQFSLGLMSALEKPGVHGFGTSPFQDSEASGVDYRRQSICLAYSWLWFHRHITYVFLSTVRNNFWMQSQEEFLSIARCGSETKRKRRHRLFHRSAPSGWTHPEG